MAETTPWPIRLQVTQACGCPAVPAPYAFNEAQIEDQTRLWSGRACWGCRSAEPGWRERLRAEMRGGAE